jgi:hypothetical protein
MTDIACASGQGMVSISTPAHQTAPVFVRGVCLCRD